MDHNPYAPPQAEVKDTQPALEIPDDILKKILETWDVIAAEEETKNPFFKKVYASQKAYASKVVPMRRGTYPDYNFAANYYYPEKK